MLANYQLDAIVAPTGGPAWSIILVNGDHYGGGCSSLAAVSGYPHITVPAGFVHELPVGSSFFAGAWSEPKLIALAHAFERGTQALQPALHTICGTLRAVESGSYSTPYRF